MTDFRPFSEVRSRLGEGPVWLGDRDELWWIDIHRGTFHRAAWTTAEVTSHKLSERSTIVIPCADGSIISSVQKGLCQVPNEGLLGPPVVDVELDTPDTSINDGKTGPDGRLYFDTLDRRQRPGMCALYRLEADGSTTVIKDGMTLGNGIDWSPDGRTMYFVDSGEQRLWALDFDPESGVTGKPRVFADVPADAGMPDGMTVDAAGDLWLALYGGGRLRRYAPDGTLRDELAVPVTYPTSCAFAGPELATLVVTTAFAHIEDAGQTPGDLDGAVLTTTVDAVGRPPVLCAAGLATHA